MSRVKYQSVVKDGNGHIIIGATISVFESGGLVVATVYEAESGGSSVSFVLSDSSGYFYFWIDDGDYAATQTFKIVISKSGFGSQEYDDIIILEQSFKLSDDINPVLGGNLSTGGFSINSISPTELSYLDGVTSGIQGQINTVSGIAATAVQNSGNESISGTKIFTGSIIVGGYDVENNIHIDSLSKTDNYSIVATDVNKQIILGSSTSSNKVFTLPSVSSNDDGMLLHFYNDSDYKLTLKPSDADAIWTSGEGYGIETSYKGSYCTLRYDDNITTWLPINIGGGLWMVEGLKLWLPCTDLTVTSIGTPTSAKALDKSHNNSFTAYGGLECGDKTGSYQRTYYFTGAAPYLQAPDSSDWDIFGSTSNDYTIFLRIYCIYASGTVEYILSHYEDASNQWSLYRTATGTLGIKYTSAGTDYIDISGGALNQATWHDIAFIKVGAESGLYVDGVQTAYDATFTADTFTGSLDIGRYGAASNYIEGHMNDIVIINQNIFNAAPVVGNTDTITIPNKINFS